MKKTLVPFLIVMLAGTTVCPMTVMAQASHKQVSLDDGAMMDGMVQVPGGTKIISVSAVSESIRGVLYNLSQQGGFNLVMDESVSGNITVELKQVPLNQALQSVASLGDILLLKQSGNIFLAISRESAQEKGLNRQLSKMIKIYYSNANRIADVLNHSIFATANNAMTSGGGSGGGGGQQGAITKVRADSRTNTVVVVGTAQEIALAEATVAKLDTPRQSKTFYLSNANAVDIATMLASSVFNDGTASIQMGASGGSGGGASAGGGAAGGAGGSTGGSSVMPSMVRVERQDIQEGSGINNFGGSSGSSEGASAGLSSAVTLRGTVKSSDMLSVSPQGVLLIPDTRQNAITIMGTAEQIATAESLIPTLDAQVPQVAIEASLIEITDTGNKEFSTRLGLGGGQLQTGFNNLAVEGVRNSSGATVADGTGLVGLPTVDATDTSSYARSGIMFTTNPLARKSDYMIQLRSLLTQNKAKILANPTIVANHDTESIISIVDEVVRRINTTVDTNGFATQTVEIGEAGIVLDILPKVGEDGTINMRLRPSITSVLSQSRDSQGNLITLLSKRDMLTQNVRVRDGETLVIGGLIQQRDSARADKLPFASDLPIIGAMFRASTKSAQRSELVMLITPHVINNTRLTPVHTGSRLDTPPVQTSMAQGQ